ncbi:MalY/PatB family protein [Sunxiuqinia sp. A32]|uniref:MalY/PatB family protein n=1 Tax=Sunxiuqinia sp. A32 TaxID=3461496 RepID=UPI004045EF4A
MSMPYNFDELVDRKNTNCVKYDASERFFGKADVLPLWVADMDFKTPDFVVDTLKERLEHDVLGYTFRPDSCTSAIVNWLKNRHRWSIKGEWLHYSPGVVPALAFAVQVYTQPGDEVIVQTPVYFPFFSAIKNNNREMVENPLVLKGDRYYFDIDDLKKKISPKTKLLLLCNPQNPGGMSWTESELKELGDICLENNVVVVSDEIHSDLTFPGKRHIPLATVSDEIAQNTITLMAPSKTFNLAGLSTSFLVIPNKGLFDKYDELMKATHVYQGNLFGNIAMEAAYSKGESWLNELMLYIEANYDFMASFFKDNLPGIKPMKPDATYLVWLDFSSYGLKDKELNEKIVNAGVGLNRGVQFGKQGKGFMRINIACPRKTLEQALLQLKSAFAT